MSYFSKLLLKETENWIFRELGANQLPETFVRESLEPDECYFEIWMKSMWIQHSRKGFNTFYPVLYSFTSFDIFGEESPEFSTVVNPTNLQAIDKRSDRIIQTNIPLVGPIPFSGGNISFEAGLFSIKEKDLSKPFLELISSISEMAGISFVRQALTFAAPLKKGIDALSGAGNDVSLEVGLNTTLEGTGMTSKMFAVLAIDQNKIDFSALKLDPHSNLLIEKSGKEFKKCPYFIFEIKKVLQKNNWADNQELAEAFKDIKSSLKKNDENSIDNNFAYFKKLLLFSGDLIKSDALKIIEKIQTLIETGRKAQSSPFEMTAGIDTIDLSDINIY